MQVKRLCRTVIAPAITRTIFIMVLTGTDRIAIYNF